MNAPLQKKYSTEIIPALRTHFKYNNVMAVPRVLKVVVNVGTSQALKDPKYLETIEGTLTRITGQKPTSRNARKSIAAFKIREGQVIGKMVTLRGSRMYDFMEKVIHVALPRLRDFRGLEQTALDQSGNLTIGFQEYNVFPEIRADEIERLHGLQATFVTNAKTKEEAFELLKLLGFPFKK
jgi:large subunit ribosomal protein L5